FHPPSSSNCLLSTGAVIRRKCAMSGKENAEKIITLCLNQLLHHGYVRGYHVPRAYPQQHPVGLLVRKGGRVAVSAILGSSNSSASLSPSPPSAINAL
ncbi:hypothetical protein KUCAC02_013927, partial [Chaenocephalus aceratus]